MTKETYLNQLKAELRGLPYDDITDIVGEISLHFDDGIKGGKSEDEVAHRLGSPKRLAFEYYIDAPSADEHRPIKNKSLAMLVKFVGLGIAGITAFPVVMVVLSVVFSIYMMILSGYFVGGVFIISPILSYFFPENINTGGVSVWMLCGAGIVILIGMRYIFKLFNRIVTRIYRHAIKKPILKKF